MHQEKSKKRYRYWKGALIVMSVVVLVGYYYGRSKPDSGISSHSQWAREYWPGRVEHFKRNPLLGGEIVLLGDSITEHGIYYKEDLYTEKKEVYRNRGISGDTSEGVLARLEEVIAGKPKAVFIKIGINDLLTAELHPEKIHNNIKKIVLMIREGSPSTHVVVQSILPTTHREVNGRVERTNRLLKESFEGVENGFLNLYPHFISQEGLLKPSFTNDGLHLTFQGYERWGELLSPFIASL